MTNRPHHSRPKLAIHPRWVGLLIVGLVSWTLIKGLGTALGLLLALPVIGFWIAYWAAEGWRGGVWWSRWLKWRQVQGHHHVFHNHPVGLRKMGGKVWIRLADVRAIVGEPASEVARRRLLTTIGTNRSHCLDKSDWWIREDALLEWLERNASVKHRQAGRLHHWLVHDALRAAHANGLMQFPSL